MTDQRVTDAQVESIRDEPFTRWEQALACDLRDSRAEVATLRAALGEAEEVLRLVEHPAFPDPIHHERVKALGREIGFGALMATASAGWREVLAERPYPTGGEFVAGPCFATVKQTLAKIRAAMGEQDRG